MNETASGVSSYRRFSHWARLACAALLLICQEAGMAVPPIAGPTMPQPVSAAQQLQPAQARIVAPQLQLTRWILRPDAPPSIAPNSEVLIFIHGMDSRAEEADDITKALFKLLPTVPQARVPPVWPPISVTVNSAIVQFTSSEPCDHPDTILNGQHVGVVPFDIVNGVPTPLYFAPMIPPQLLDTPPPTGTQINGPAAHNIGANEGRLRPELRSTAAAADPRQSLRMAAFRFAAGDPVWGRAYADLSVTGHRSFANFRQLLPGESFCQWVIGHPPPPDAPSLTPETVLSGCHTALDRAYRVANFLRTGQRGDTPALKAAKIAERNALGWIAVSGEDDSPHRPVNVPSSDFPQYDVQVNVATPLGPPPGFVTVHSRYTIAQSQIPGRNLTVISVDLPTSGYADNLNYNLVSPLTTIGVPKSGGTDFQATGMAPLLDFIEEFVVQFVVALDHTVPFKNGIKAVIGGSLGGNIAFRLGRRPNVPWFPQFVVWSPASIWDSLGWGADVLKHQAPLQAWNSANQAMTAPGPGDRAAFFASWDKPTIPVLIPAQSDTWTSDFYICKESSVAAARLDRQETYDALFLAWHWRLGGEQLLFSHQAPDPVTHQPLFMSNHKPMLLGCGLEDHFPGTDICPATQQTAKQMQTTPGRALFLGQTGHSLDNERRSFWAQQMIGFLGL